MSSSYSSLNWVLSHWSYFTVRRFIYGYVCVFCVCVFFCQLHMCYIIVTWCGGQSLGPWSSFSAWHCWHGWVNDP